MSSTIHGAVSPGSGSSARTGGGAGSGLSGERRRRPVLRLRAEVVHAAKVALAACLLVGVVYVACVGVLDRVVSDRLTDSVDARLSDRISDENHLGPQRASRDDDDIDSTPVYLWRVTAAGIVAAPGSPAPRLPAGVKIRVGRPVTVQLPQSRFRLAAGVVGSSILIAGQSLQSEDRVTTLLREGEALAAPVLLLAMFVGALAIGLRALSPVENSRRRQLEFTADASHELRTPLSVITAETSLALSAQRTAADYRAVLGRIERESDRLRKIVEDLLWLARFDSAPPQPASRLVDLAAIAAECAGRFRALGATGEFRVQVQTSGPGSAWISAPPEWVDRLAGVLVDNACRHAGSGGLVRVSAIRRGNRILLTVEDSGPGVPAEDRRWLFDRFHRSTEQGGSAGLGLAIADSIVRSTDGQWRLADSALGGALFEVSWRRPNTRRHGAPDASASVPPAPTEPPAHAERPLTRADSPAAETKPTLAGAERSIGQTEPPVGRRESPVAPAAPRFKADP
ncbi:MAG TPA: HAMP domain-containing sensor histidine kinase [Streptosporangiaceae bacterium]